MDPIQTPYKYYVQQVNGQNEYQVLPFAGNTPYGNTELSASDYVTGLNQKIQGYQSKISNNANLQDGQPGYAPASVINSWGNTINTLKSQIADVQNGKYAGGSGYTIQNGVPMTVASYQQQQKIDAGIKDGTLKMAAPGEYVPTGSAADSSSAAYKAASISTPTPMSVGQIGAPTSNLQPGDTGAGVKQLQDYLVAGGYLTRDQVNTGYGIYGPQTTAAVAALQKALGVDNSSGVGYFGPLTRSAVLNGSSNPPSGSIGATGLGSSSGSPTLPTGPGTSDYSKLIQGGLAGLFPSTGASTGTGSATQNLLDYLGASTAPPSTADAYTAAYNASPVAADQQTVNDLTAQLNSAVAEAGVANQTLESQAGGKDVTTDFLGKQQQEVTRQSAIKILPIQAQLAAAQGNLTFAQTQLDTTFKLKSQDQTDQYNYQQKLRDAVFQFATDEQKAVLTAQQNVDDHNFTLEQNNLNNAQAIATTAIDNGHADIAAAILKLDPASPTYNSDVANLAAKITLKPASTSSTTGVSTADYNLGLAWLRQQPDYTTAYEQQFTSDPVARAKVINAARAATSATASSGS